MTCSASPVSWCPQRNGWEMLAFGALCFELYPCIKSDCQNTVYLDWFTLASHGNIFTALFSWFLLKFLCYRAISSYLWILFKSATQNTVIYVIHCFPGRTLAAGSQSLEVGLRGISSSLRWRVQPSFMEWTVVLNSSSFPYPRFFHIIIPQHFSFYLSFKYVYIISFFNFSLKHF